MTKPESKRPIAIEDLLRVKRAERPPAEFWTQFDRDLRAKQLAALVARRPWWQRVPTPWPFFARHRILLGASAALAITFVSLRGPRTATPTVANAEPVAAAASHAVNQAVTGVVVGSLAAENTLAGVESALAAPRQDTAVNSSAPAVVAATEAASASDRAFRILPMIGAPGPVVEFEAPPAAGRFVSSGLVAAVPMGAPLPRVLAASSGFEARAMPARTTVEPLQQMTSPTESRRARMHTAMVSTKSMESSARTTQRVANRIEEERLYDQVNRIGARGDRLSVKF